MIKKKLISDWKAERERNRNRANGKSLITEVLNSAESAVDIYNTTTTGDKDEDKDVEVKSVEERAAAKLRLAKWKADRLEKEEKMKVCSGFL